MKKLILFSLLTSMIIACNNSSSGDSDSKYGIESGMITYKSNMMGMEIITTQYFKDHGDIEAVVTEMEMMGQKSKQHSLRKDGFYYSYTEGQPEGSKFKIDEPKDSVENQKLTEANILKKGGKKLGEEKLLGKSCNIYEFTEQGATTKVWIWKNMLIKMQAKQGEMEVTMEATELKESSDFPAGIFDVPADVNFKDMQNEPTNLEDPNAKG